MLLLLLRLGGAAGADGVVLMLLMAARDRGPYLSPFIDHPTLHAEQFLAMGLLPWTERGRCTYGRALDAISIKEGSRKAMRPIRCLDSPRKPSALHL